MSAPQLGDTVLYEPPEDWKKPDEQRTMVGKVVRVELQEGGDPNDERSYDVCLFTFPCRNKGNWGWAVTLGYSRTPKPDHWRWREVRPHA